jgi:hypothetical protein
VRRRAMRAVFGHQLGGMHRQPADLQCGESHLRLRIERELSPQRARVRPGGKRLRAV